MKARELELAPLPSSSFFVLCATASASLCHFTLSSPGWGLHILSFCCSSPAHRYNSFLLSFPIIPAKCHAFCPLPGDFLGAFLCLSTLQSGTLQQYSFIICMPNPSVSGSPR